MKKPITMSLEMNANINLKTKNVAKAIARPILLPDKRRSYQNSTVRLLILIVLGISVLHAVELVSALRIPLVLYAGLLGACGASFSLASRIKIERANQQNIDASTATNRQDPAAEFLHHEIRTNINIHIVYGFCLGVISFFVLLYISSVTDGLYRLLPSFELSAESARDKLSILTLMLERAEAGDMKSAIDDDAMLRNLSAFIVVSFLFGYAERLIPSVLDALATRVETMLKDFTNHYGG